jgi:hypothetical protein
MSSIIAGVSASVAPQVGEKKVSKTKDAEVSAKAKSVSTSSPESKSSGKADANAKVKTENQAAVFEKTKKEDTNKEPYKINKMSKEDRAALVKALKEEVEARQKQFLELVKQSLTGQGEKIAIATDNMDGIWKALAKGNFTVSEEVKKQAQEDISEKGYWGVEQTSKRMFEHASALAGDDVEQMKAMQKAMEKGYKEATKAWGKELPDISKKTLEAANKLFEDYYKSKGVTSEKAMTAQVSSELTAQAAAQSAATANTTKPQPDPAAKGVQSVSKS